MFRLGIISEIGEGENLGYARVSFDENEIVSGWLAMPSMATYKTKHWVPTAYRDIIMENRCRQMNLNQNSSEINMFLDNMFLDTILYVNVQSNTGKG